MPNREGAGAAPDRPPERDVSVQGALWENRSVLGWRIRVSRIGESLLPSSILLWLLPLAVGAFLRLYQLGSQIVADDEWHSVSQVLHNGFLEIAANFGGADHCIPLTLFYEAAANWLGLSEWVMRLPVLFGGLASLVLMPLAVRGVLGNSVARNFAWLLAVCPLLIFYSRYARPYSLSVLLGFLAAMSFFRWWSGEGQGWAVWFVVLGVLAPYFHLTAIPFVLVPLSYGLLDGLAGRSPYGPRQKALRVPLLFIAIGWTVLLGPPLWLNPGAVMGKMADGSVGPVTILGALSLLLGTSHQWLQGLLVLFAGVGFVTCWSQRRSAAVFLGLLLVGQVMFVVALSPEGVGVPIVLARYLLPALPVVLLWVSVGLSRILRAAAAAPMLSGLLVVLGPIPGVYYYPNNWTNHGLFQYSYNRLEDSFSYQRVLQPVEVPEFYRKLGESPAGRLTIVEAPWHLEWLNNNYPFLQQVHRQWMMVGLPGDLDPSLGTTQLPQGDTRFDFDLFFFLTDLQRARELGIRFVVFHKDLSSEIPNTYPRRRLDVSGWIDFYIRQVGPPLFEDEQIVVFEMTPRELAQREINVERSRLSFDSGLVGSDGEATIGMGRDATRGKGRKKE